MRSFLFAAAALLAACSPAQQPAATSARPVDDFIAVERAFAAEAARGGWVEAFESYAADDAILLAAAPVNAHENLAGIDPANRGDTSLGWSPEYAGASADGTLGFTTGPYNGGDTAFGQYFTVWKRQDDGSLKWIYDGGINQTTPTVLAPDFDVAVIEPSAEGTDADVDIANAEAELATAAATNAAALADVLAAGGRVNRDNQPSAVGADAARALLARGPATVTYAPPLRTEVTPDLAWTLGEARWEGGFGYYGRIWVLVDGEGWKIAFDQIIDRSPEATVAP